jgi:hypothetical protein
MLRSAGREHGPVLSEEGNFADREQKWKHHHRELAAFSSIDDADNF